MKSPFVVIGIFVLAVIVLVLWTWPAFQEFSLARNALNAAETETQSREAYFAKLASLQRELQQYPTELSYLNAAFPLEENLPSLYDTVQDVAASSGLVLTAVSSSVVEDSSPKEVEVNVTVEGSYAGLKEFLQRVQQSSRLMNVTSLEFATPKEGTRFEFHIHIMAYAL
ncbi:MAG: type 4a pilus biogenesis protein PilO [bacterium]|nr:type 4a pilus biogenesis protein PilO [bacterium]